MAAPSSPNQPSGPWALLWFGGVAAAAWVPLLLADVLPWGSTTTPASGATALLPPLQPQVVSLAAPADPLGVRPSPWLDRERPGVPLPAEPEAEAAVLFTPAPALAAGTASGTQPLPGSLLLGGPLTLASLHEKPMVPAARLEQTLRARSTDRLSAVPLHWRPTMEALVQGKNNVMPAEVVRVPAPHLQKPEEYPMAVQPDGVAETPVNPSAPSRQALERWAERQSPTPQGTVRPVVVVLEPLAVEPTP
jgi:hypothetical protein